METKYPLPNEKKWPSAAKLSKGTFHIDRGLLGAVTSDGFRGYICTVCGRVVTAAHHVKPALYRVKYEGRIYYLEQHICDQCMVLNPCANCEKSQCEGCDKA